VVALGWELSILAFKCKKNELTRTNVRTNLSRVGIRRSQVTTMSAPDRGPQQVGAFGKWTLRYPELGTGPVSHVPNISAEYFEKERERLFKRVWLLLCREEEVARPGSYAVKQLPVLDTSVLLVRGDDGVVRAFHNSCRHRGNKVVMGAGEKAGDSKGFMCGFHGWVYDLRGRLVHVVDEEDFFDIDKCALGLKPINCSIWRGFVFINVMEEPTQRLDEYLGQWGRDMAGFPFEEFELVNVYSTTVNCNWKIALDATQEGYHVGTLHARSANSAAATPENPFCHLLDVRLYPEGHRYISFPANRAFKPAPAVALAVKYAGNNIYASVNPTGQVSGTNRSRAENWLFDINIIFPNVQLGANDTTYFTQHQWPISVQQTYWELRQYLRRSHSVAGRIAQQNTQAALRDVIREDLSTLENTQSVLKSGAISHMTLNDSEVALRHSYRIVDEYVKDVGV
jgi:phenylpropionate dioxygenase-like ring-hydroxylating dioxygenase large terminal subunit